MKALANKILLIHQFKHNYFDRFQYFKNQIRIRLYTFNVKVYIGVVAMAVYFKRFLRIKNSHFWTYPHRMDHTLSVKYYFKFVYHFCVLN